MSVSNTSKRTPPVVTRPRLITVGRGRVPVRKGLDVSASPQIGRGVVSVESEYPSRLRRPNVLVQSATVVKDSNDSLAEEDIVKVKREKETRLMKEKFAQLKDENEFNANTLKLKIASLEKEKGMEIRRLELRVKMLEIENRRRDSYQETLH